MAPIPAMPRHSMGPAAALAALLLAGLSCAAKEHESALMRSTPGVQATTAELRIYARGMVPRMSGIIEKAADDMARKAPEARWRTEALRWKTEMVPAMTSALFQPDPLAALVDSWALVVQMSGYFRAGPGTSWPAGMVAEGLGACDAMDAEMALLATKVAPGADAARTRELIGGWARANPLTTLSARQSTASLLAQVTAQKGGGGFASLSSMQETVGDIAARVDVLAAALPKQARWQAELLLDEQLDGRRLADSARDIASISGSASRIAAVAGDLSSTVPDLQGQITSEREAVLADVQRQRLETQAFVTAERGAVLEAVGAERVALLEGIRQERIAAVAALHQERLEAFRDLEAMSLRLVDHVLLRLALGLIALLVIVFAGALALARAWRAPGRS